MYTCTGAKNRGAKAQSTDRQSSRWRRPCEGTLYERDRRLRCEDERRLCVSVQCAGCYFFFSLKLTKTSSIRDRLLLSSKRSSLSLYRLRDVWALTEKQPVSTSLGVFRHEVAQTALPRKNLNKKTSAYMIVRELGERGSSSSSEESRVYVCLRHFFFGFFLSKLVRSWRRPICREMTGISRHVTLPWRRLIQTFSACVHCYRKQFLIRKDFDISPDHGRAAQQWDRLCLEVS